MSVKVTSTMTDFIAWLKSDPVITDVSISEVDPSYIEMLPTSIVEPLLFTISLNNPSSGSTGTANVILPEIYYNRPTGSGWNPPTEQFWNAARFDHADLFGLELPTTITYVDPAIEKMQPMWGFSSTPVDLNSADPQLEVLSEKLSTITNTVVFYRYLSSQVLQHLGTDEAYYAYCYFGTEPFTTFLGGQDAVGVAITKADYVSTATHQYIVDFVDSKINEYKGL
jgi:hypothetical protein